MRIFETLLLGPDEILGVCMRKFNYYLISGVFSLLLFLFHEFIYIYIYIISEEIGME